MFSIIFRESGKIFHGFSVVFRLAQARNFRKIFMEITTGPVNLMLNFPLLWNFFFDTKICGYFS